MSRRTHQVIFGVSVAALAVLHVWDFGLAGNDEPNLVFGWIPSDVAYRLVWMTAAAAVVFHMTSGALWPEPPEEESA